MIKENGKVVRCPKCDSTDIKHVYPFDYVKQCENRNCSYRASTNNKYKYQWSTGVHN